MAQFRSTLAARSISGWSSSVDVGVMMFWSAGVDVATRTIPTINKDPSKAAHKGDENNLQSGLDAWIQASS